MNARLTASSALIFMMAAASAQSPFGTATERARTQQAACEAAGAQAASQAKGNEVALARSSTGMANAAASSATFSKCDCKEVRGARVWDTTWVCTKRWTLTAGQ